MRKLTFSLLPFLLAGCAHSEEIRSTDTLLISGTEDQITALLNDEKVSIGASMKLLSDRSTKAGRRELRYGMSDATPYREIGGLVFYAQVHGNKVKFEKKR